LDFELHEKARVGSPLKMDGRIEAQMTFLCVQICRKEDQNGRLGSLLTSLLRWLFGFDFSHERAKAFEKNEIEPWLKTR
jgi:hypothetical protein